MFDKRAHDILFKAYWSPDGWTNSRVSAEDFAYAQARGYMFDPVHLSHDEAVAGLLAAREAISPQTVANAFLASLGSRRLEWRSALGSYGFARHFPGHRLAGSPRELCQSGNMHCHICGAFEHGRDFTYDLSVLSFEKHMWGGVRHEEVVYAWFDLTTAQQEEVPEATARDRNILRAIIAVARSQAPDAKVSDLAEALKSPLPVPFDEHRMLIEVLAICGILRPQDHPGYGDAFPSWIERTRTADYKTDWGYPAFWWTGKDSVNQAMLDYYFPGL